MTTELDRQNGRASSDHWDQPAPSPRAPARPRPCCRPDVRQSRQAPRQGLLARYPAWPIIALLVGYPLWWALGIADYMFVVLAIPMAMRLYSWRARGRRLLRLPPGFSLWLLFLICMLAGAATLGADRAGHDRQPGREPDHRLRRPGRQLPGRHRPAAVRREPDRARAAPAAARLAARAGRDLRDHRRLRRHTRPDLPVHLAARAGDAEEPPEQHARAVDAASRARAGPGRSRASPKAARRRRSTTRIAGEIA